MLKGKRVYRIKIFHPYYVAVVFLPAVIIGNTKKGQKRPVFERKRVGWINPPSKRQKAVKRDFSEK